VIGLSGVSNRVRCVVNACSDTAKSASCCQVRPMSEHGREVSWSEEAAECLVWSAAVALAASRRLWNTRTSKAVYGHVMI